MHGLIIFLPVVELKCAVQCYAWGKIGLKSAVALLAQHSPSFKLEEDKPYSEFWMGTHPNGPSTVLDGENETLLSDWIYANVDVLGPIVKETFDGKLPFLFKVLSVNKALSIQAHPNKSHATVLHKERPEIYKDPNHKPEMAIALTPFEGLCGFRPLTEIQKYLNTVPEIAGVIGQDAANAIASGSDPLALKKAFTALMKSRPDVVSLQLNKLLERLREKKSSGHDISEQCGELVLRLNSQFPGDVGCFCIYFLNHVVLQPGEAMFLGPNLPHAYLAGDCMECMACSDNVVRAGLTPKFKDVDTLCEMLDYKCGTKEENIFPCHKDPSDQYVTIYDPPVADFAVARIQIPASCPLYKFQALNGPSIALLISGSGAIDNATNTITATGGTVLFIPANTSFDFKCNGQDTEIYRAFCVV